MASSSGRRSQQQRKQTRLLLVFWLQALCLRGLLLLAAAAWSGASTPLTIVPLETRHGAHLHRGRSLLRYGTLPILGAVREG